jgi:hypothetical protein
MNSSCDNAVASGILSLAQHFCRSGPTCRSCLRDPPRLIFVGVTDRLLEKSRSAKAIGRGWDGVDFWASTPVCGPCPRRTFSRRPILPWASPLAGLSGTDAVHRRGLVTAIRRSPAAGAPRATSVRPRDARLSAHGFATFLPVTQQPSESCLAAPLVIAKCLVFARPSSLQRIDAADACPT